MTTIGKGMRDPIAPNDVPEGRAQNRRIEFHVMK
jgi:outer membrane protein OmpA-like peptidoglycan-associated protein